MTTNSAVDPYGFVEERDPHADAYTSAAADCYPLGAPPPGKRRAVAHPGAPCTVAPTVTVAVQPTACENERVRIAWQASDPRARVAIKGVACDLPATGSVDVRISQDTTIHIVASTCKIGPEVTARVLVAPAPSISSFAADHATLAPGYGTALHFTYENASAWTIAGGQTRGFSDASGGVGSFGGSTTLFFPTVPASPTLTVMGPCGSTFQTLTIAACPPNTQLPEVIGSGANPERSALGQTQIVSILVAAARWWVETDNGVFTPSSGPGPNDNVQVQYTPARAGDRVIWFFGEGECGIYGSGGTSTVWDCSKPLIEHLTMDNVTLTVGQTTPIRVGTQSRDGQLVIPSVTSSLGNPIGDPIADPWPLVRFTYSAAKAGNDTVTIRVQTPCGTAEQKITVMVR